MFSMDSEYNSPFRGTKAPWEMTGSRSKAGDV